MTQEYHVHLEGLSGEQFVRADRFTDKAQHLHPRKHMEHRPGSEDDDHTVDVWFTDEAEADAFRLAVTQTPA